jgi:hypothetical protein
MTYDVNANRGPVLISSVWPVAAVAILSILARLTSRRLKQQPLKSDDWVAVAGLVSQ